MNTEKLADLRQPFPAKAVGKLPRLTCKRCSEAPGKVCSEHHKRQCNACGNYISERHIDLDYVGHAEVTDRLLSVDPEWTWEPVAFDQDGGPLVRRSGNELTLWIRLTVCGVTRIGVGSVAAGTFDADKQLIGDALRNAAMRFGVALDLWSKTELESATTEEPPEAPPPSREPPATANGLVCDVCGGSLAGQAVERVPGTRRFVHKAPCPKNAQVTTEPSETSEQLVVS